MLHVLGLLFWLVVIPFCIGLIPANFIAAPKRSPGFVMLAGYFGMWAVFETVTIPAVLFVKYDNFKTASVLFFVAAIACAAAGVWLFCRSRQAGEIRLVRDRRTNGNAASRGEGQAEEGAKNGAVFIRLADGIRQGILKMSMAERIEWLLFAVLLGFQLYMAVAYASFDGDDAYYVVESLIAQQADVMYRILPYTGRPTDLDIRHALAVFPMWIAFVAVRSDIHATIVSHSIMPLVLIPLSYLVYFEIGRALFDTSVGKKAARGRKHSGTAQKAARRAQGREKDSGAKRGDTAFCRENLPVFMIMMAMFQIFGNVSIYTNETFFLTRTWQGKAVAGSLVIPAVFWMFLRIYNGTVKKERIGAGWWIVFVCINMTAGVCSSIAVFLVSILMAVTAFALAAVERDIKVIVRLGAVCIPNVVYMAIYVIVGYSYLLR